MSTPTQISPHLPMTPFGITFTGLDSRTTQAQVEDLLADPRVELAVLYSASPEGRNRYPDRGTIARLLEWCRGRGALHVCGTRARDALIREQQPVVGWVPMLSRLQVNGNPTRDEVEGICDLFPNTPVLTQHNELNERLLAVVAPNHALLVDGSLGTGTTPDRWTRPKTGKAVGFAGGLGPDTIDEALPKILALARKGDWIDMETGVRTDDWFDVRKCLEVLGRVKG